MSRADELRAQLEIVEAEEALVRAKNTAQSTYLAHPTAKNKAAYKAAALELAAWQAATTSAQAQGIHAEVMPAPVGVATNAPTPGTGEREG